MDTQMVRTTITLPKYIVDDLRRTSLQGKSFGEEITVWYRQVKGLPSRETTVEEDLAFFKKIGSSGVQNIDLVQAIRDDRDRDNV